MKVSGPKFDALVNDELKLLYDLFNKNNFELRIAGGPVRDLLMSIQPADIDLATTATPTQMKELFDKENIRMLHKKGEEHGTITCRLNNKENFEITTLRIDVVCDGRRAEVEYTTDWKLDAFRRDLTINSLFLGLDGTVYDYTGGIDDIKERRVRFVGKAVQRIQEDYLRIFRYFRFYGRIASTPDNHSKETLETIKNNRKGIKNLSGERIWTEFRQILVGRFAPELMKTMIVDCDLAEYLALPPKYARDNLRKFDEVSKNIINLSSESEKPLPSTVLATFMENIQDISNFNLRLKLSTVEKTLCEFIVEYRDMALERQTDLIFFRDIVLDNTFLYGAQAREPSLRFTIELLKYIGAEDTLQRVREWALEDISFPVNGLSLMKAGTPKGPQVKAILHYLHDLWKASNCTLTEEDLIPHVRDSNIPSAPPKEFRKRRWVQMS